MSSDANKILCALVCLFVVGVPASVGIVYLTEHSSGDDGSTPKPKLLGGSFNNSSAGDSVSNTGNDNHITSAEEIAAFVTIGGCLLMIGALIGCAIKAHFCPDGCGFFGRNSDAADSQPKEETLLVSGSSAV